MFSYLIFVANPVLLIKGKIFISFNTIILLFFFSINLFPRLNLSFMINVSMYRQTIAIYFKRLFDKMNCICSCLTLYIFINDKIMKEKSILNIYQS